MSDRNDISEGDVDRLPGWRRLYAGLVEMQLKPRDFIPLAWVEEQLGISRESVRNMADADRYDLTLLRAHKAFDQLLTRDNVDLKRQSNPKGWVVLTAQEQIERANHDLRDEMRRAFVRSTKRKVNLDTLQLTDAEHAKHLERLAKESMLRSMIRREMRAIEAPKPAKAEDDPS